MTNEIDKVVEKAIQEAHPNLKVVVTPDPPKMNVFIPPNVAHNIIELLKRVQTTGFEAYALVEAVTILNPLAQQHAQGPGQQFVPASQAR